MTALPPFDDQWVPLTLTATPDGNGKAEGVLTVGGAIYHVRGWHRAASGVLKAEVQAVRSAEWEAYLDRVTAKAVAP